MRDDDELVVPADVREPLASLYWLFPFTRAVPDPKRPHELISLPLAPRAAPRRQIDAAAKLLGRAIPDWVVALWSCKVRLGAYADQEAAQLGTYLVEVDRAAHAAGAPRELVFFAGDARLYPGVESSRSRGRRVVTEFVEGVLDDVVYGFDPADTGAPTRMIVYRHSASDPARRLERVELAAFLAERERSDLECDDTEVYSKELYASILRTRDARRPAFRIAWERSTPGIAPPAPETAAPAGPVRVRHATFGVGRVVAREGKGAAEKLTIAFADGTRVVLARFVAPADPG